MKVNAKQLHDAARKLKPWTQRRATIPVLETIRLKVGKGILELAATDLDTSATIDVDETDNYSGDAWGVCVEARTLVATLGKLKGAGSVELTGAKGELWIEAGKRTVKLKGLEEEDFPQLAEVEGWETELEAGALVEAIGRVGYAVSKEQSRFALQAFYLESAGDGSWSRLVGTDGHRMAWADLPCAGPESPVLVHQGWVKVPRLGLAGPGTLRLSESHAAYRQGGVEVTGRLVEGTFPDYQRVISRDHPHWAEATAKDWISALKWGGSMSGKGVVEVRSNGDGLAVLARDPDRGESREQIEAQTEGEWSVRLNAAYLVEAIGALAPVERVRIRVTDENTQVGIEAETGQSILMPCLI